MISSLPSAYSVYDFTALNFSAQIWLQDSTSTSWPLSTQKLVRFLFGSCGQCWLRIRKKVYPREKLFFCEAVPMAIIEAFKPFVLYICWLPRLSYGWPRHICIRVEFVLPKDKNMVTLSHSSSHNTTSITKYWCSKHGKTQLELLKSVCTWQAGPRKVTCCEQTRSLHFNRSSLLKTLTALQVPPNTYYTS